MHQLRSKYNVRSFRITALLYIAGILLAVGLVVILTLSLVTGDRRLLTVGLGCGVLFVIAGGVRCVLATLSKCPLCITPVLAGRRCSKHRHARSLFGSHRLRVSFSILFKNSFRCPYCNESTAIKVRQRNRETSRRAGA